MFIDSDVNDDKLFQRLNKQPNYHYEIEIFDNRENIDLYLQEILCESTSTKDVNQLVNDSVIENFDDYKNQDLFLQRIISDYEKMLFNMSINNCTFESVMQELSEI
ncbi:MAG: hypothetical protein ACRDD7_14120 [Peptostreptococcaceae bacterium]